jgi:hypothetical protein
MSNNKCTGCGRRPRRLPRSTCDLQRQERQKEKFVNKNKKRYISHTFSAHTNKTNDFLSPIPFALLENSE